MLGTRRERERDAVEEGEIAWKETEISGVKRISGSRSRNESRRKGRDISDREEGQSVS